MTKAEAIEAIKARVEVLRQELLLWNVISGELKYSEYLGLGNDSFLILQSKFNEFAILKRALKIMQESFLKDVPWGEEK